MIQVASSKEREEKTVVVHTRLPLKVEQDLRHLVSEGYYSNISDALRDAARRLLREHQHLFFERRIPPKIELREVKLKPKK